MMIRGENGAGKKVAINPNYVQNVVEKEDEEMGTVLIVRQIDGEIMTLMGTLDNYLNLIYDPSKGKSCPELKYEKKEVKNETDRPEADR